MLRVHFLQHWFNLFDSAAEAGLYDSRSMRRFVSIDLGHERVPDETIICKFRNFIEANNLGQQLFKLIQKYLGENGIKVHRGTIVDTTIISASSSTKNREGKRDPEMRQTRKGNQWYFGMKTHVGVDSRTKLIHSMVATSANVHNSQVLSKLLHGKKTQVYGDSTYMEQREVIRSVVPAARGFTQRRGSRYRKLIEGNRRRNRNKSRVHSKKKHPFLVIKKIFGFQKHVIVNYTRTLTGLM